MTSLNCSSPLLPLLPVKGYMRSSANALSRLVEPSTNATRHCSEFLLHTHTEHLISTELTLATVSSDELQAQDTVA